MSTDMSDTPPVVETSEEVPASPSKEVEQEGSSHGSKILKSGFLFLSTRGIGWTSWKKRWFVLTQTSLVFFRTDPNEVLPNSTEVLNVTLGGIDLNSSGSVNVKEDKKLITVQFSDGQEERIFTLKAETAEDLLEWKVALEEALANAPSLPLPNDQENAADVADQSTDKQPEKSMVLGRPVLYALEETDGTPSFLEKALRFVEEHGVKVEGILRLAADVENVESRIREYEQGKTEFSPEEDGHVIADCVKYVLRELPSPPVPASCCTSLLQACRTDRHKRVYAMRNAILETFPEPNRRLLQRILTMMQTIAAHKDQNRMSVSAVAACMAPLLLRPLLHGECDLQQKFDVDDESAAQLMQAAAAANHAHSICIFLLEEYDNLFGVGDEMPEMYSDSEYTGSESGEYTEDDEVTESGSEYESTEGSDAEDDDDKTKEDKVDDDKEHSSSGAINEAGRSKDDDEGSGSSQANSGVSVANAPNPIVVSKGRDNDGRLLSNLSSSITTQKFPNILKGAILSAKRPALWSRSRGRKNLSMDSIDIPFKEESDIQRLMATKLELQFRIAEETRANEQLLGRLESRKSSLHEWRLILQKDVARLKEEFQNERELRRALEAGLTSQEQVPESALLDKKESDDLGARLSTHSDQN